MSAEAMPVAGQESGATGAAPAGAEGAPEAGAPVPGAEVEASEGGEGGRSEGRQGDLPPAVYREVKALRGMRQELAQLREVLPVLQELAKSRAQPVPKPSETQVTDFYRDPQGTLEKLLDAKLKGLVPSLRETMDQRESQAAFNQRLTEASKWIESQKDYSPESEEELVSMLNAFNDPQNVLMRAQAVMALWRSNRGAGSGTQRIPKAAAAGGAPVAGIPGRRGDMKAQMDAIMADPKTDLNEKMKALDELKSTVIAGA